MMISSSSSNKTSDYNIAYDVNPNLLIKKNTQLSTYTADPAYTTAAINDNILTSCLATKKGVGTRTKYESHVSRYMISFQMMIYPVSLFICRKSKDYFIHSSYSISCQSPFKRQPLNGGSSTSLTLANSCAGAALRKTCSSRKKRSYCLPKTSAYVLDLRSYKIFIITLPGW